MDGLLLIDKAPGMTSHDVVARVRRLLRTRRVGHTGTLDPMATGVLPVAVGQATRLVEFLMDGPKTYRATLKLGEVTDTQDAEGTVVAHSPVGNFSPSDIQTACGAFLGDIQQIPPMYSALKKDGVPLYRLARQGLEVTREARTVHISRLELCSVALPYVELEVVCSKGTYIRTLVHDLGNTLGPGAHLTQLCRTQTGGFRRDECIVLEDLAEDAQPGTVPAFLTLVEALRGWPLGQVDPEGAARLFNGIPPLASQVAVGSWPEGELMALVRHERLLAVVRCARTRSKEKRGDFELLRVFPAAAAA